MAKHDDIDLIRLFGLSQDEANGLGLDASGRLPQENELPAHADAEPDPSSCAPAHGDGYGSIDAVPSSNSARNDINDLLDDELAILAMLDNGEQRNAASYNGHGALRGLSLASNAEPLDAPLKLVAAAEPLPQLELIAPLEEDDERFIVTAGDDDADSSDDADLIGLFGLSTDEANGLGLGSGNGNHHDPSSRYSAEDVSSTAIAAGAVEDEDENEDNAGASTHLVFPTMHLHAIGDADDSTSGFFIADPNDDMAAAQWLEPSAAGLAQLDDAAIYPVGDAELSADLTPDAPLKPADSGASVGAFGGIESIVPPAASSEGAVYDALDLAIWGLADEPRLAGLSVDRGMDWEPAADAPTAAADWAGDALSVSVSSPVPIQGLDQGRDQDQNQNRDSTQVPYTPNIPTVDPDLLDAFAEESAELLDGLHLELERLESDVDDHGALLETRRIIHTLKGGAKMCGFEVVASLAHSCENLLDLIADGAAALDGPALHALFDCEPLLRTAVQDAIAGEVTDVRGPNALAARFDALCVAVSAACPDATADADEGAIPAISLETEPEPEDEDTEEWSAPRASDDVDIAEEIIAAPAVHGEAEPASGETTIASETAPEPQRRSPAAELWRPAAPATNDTHDGATPAPRPAGRRGSNSISVDLNKVDSVVAKVTEMAAHRASSQGMIGQLMETSQEARRNVTRLNSLVMQIGNECASIQPDEIKDDDLNLESYNALNTLIFQLQEAVSDQQAMIQSIHDTITSHWSLQATESRVDADIQSALMSIRLIPIGNMRVRLDGVVRQAAEATGKLVRWQLQGSSVAVEKNVFDRLFEPLMHLLRNAIDHGIETPVARREAGKPETGAITVSAGQEGNQIVISIADDGDGIIPNKIATLAVERGIVTAEQAGGMSHQQKIGLIFTPGFSTADKVSHISGRGVGMDAVHEACLRMGGSIDVSSRPGVGSTFTMRLPLSLSVTRGLIIRDGGCLMVLPVTQVTALHLVSSGDVVETQGGRVARIEGQELPVYNLPPLPGAVPASYVQNGEVNVLQVTHNGGSIGLLIEDVLGEEEVLIKAPPALLRGVKTLLGAYVLPDGRVAPVVNLPQMLVDLRTVTTLTAPKEEGKATELRALIVDDSMSMRVALSGTLQGAGFTVLTARDGQEALEVLKREGLPSLVTLDVEMPRMDGLETLYAIRQMAGAQQLPVFMMTSRGGAKHRRAAEQLGATRYFTKPYRDSELATAAREVCNSAISA